ncbi:bacitracin transport system permease protein [Paenibacillus sp. UNCCL117]|uniref:ABC transporter permease n=1 Tax=unclassified Paenibacillus TaxID=185978 RepID=UPI0008823F7A|nr:MULTISPECIES: ABC transporter permease [unclassified Paenibacillus]SDE62016.1 bacitracin transport system permease protein [Paenibacillus sp. cl123]SFW69861.1 bacitracin transport system permease protein [Paenibacillus sp. UNCCL117]
MVDLLYTELLKLKRAKMFTVSLAGAAAAPAMVFIGYLDLKAKRPDELVLFSELFSETNLYVLLLIGTLLYGVITAYLFNREFAEDTLKHLLTIPVSRTGMIVSKLVLLLLWIMALTLTAWLLTLVFGLILQVKGLQAAVLGEALRQYVLGGFLLFLLSTPTMLVTFLFRSYVPTIIFTAVLTMANVALVNREYKALFPWSAVHVIASGSAVPEYPLLYSVLAVLAASAAGLAATVVYFRRMDIQ